MPDLRGPDWTGATLGNLAAELELRLTGDAQLPGLFPHLAHHLPDSNGFVLLLIDGLGSAQLGHPAAASLAADLCDDLDAPFPATTTVSLATLATATAPARHGLISYLMHFPDHGLVNTIKWITPGTGSAVPVDVDTFLPSPNLWERVRTHGAEPIVVQPGNFEGSSLTRALYRGCRFEPYWSLSELAEAVGQLSGPGRIIVAYFPAVDFHAHVSGQSSSEYLGAIEAAGATWDRLCATVDPSVALVATGDHGHIDIPSAGKHRISSRGLTIYGDPRALLLRGDAAQIRSRLSRFEGDLVPLSEARPWWGPGPDHPHLSERLPDYVFLPAPGTIVLPGFMDDRLIGYHGGLDPGEAKIPLIVRG